LFRRLRWSNSNSNSGHKNGAPGVRHADDRIIRIHLIVVAVACPSRLPIELRAGKREEAAAIIGNAIDDPPQCRIWFAVGRVSPNLGASIREKNLSLAVGRTSNRVTNAGRKERLVSGIGGETGLIALVVGLKSKSCGGALKTPDVDPAPAAKTTWPLGRTARSVVAPNGEEIPFNVPIMSGLAAQVFVEGS
jgi:hypothetical protein